MEIHSPWRDDFPALLVPMNDRPFAFLDSAASAQKPRVVIEAMDDVMRMGYANIHRGLYERSAHLTTRFEAARAAVAAFIGAKTPENIVFTRNATEGTNLIAQSWGRAHVAAGDEIILTEMEHHANIVPWQMLAAEKGAQIKVWPIRPDGTLSVDDLLSLVTPRTKVITLTHVSNVLGTVNDVAAITRAIKSVREDILVVIDGAQGAVHADVNVSHIGCDFYVITGHKLYGPTGVGAVYGRADIWNRMSPWMGGGDMVERVVLPSGTTFRAPPARFEAGTPPIVEVIGLHAALDYLTKIGRDRIAAHEQAITQEMAQALKSVPGLTIYGAAPQRAGIFSFTLHHIAPEDAAMILDKCGVAVRTGHHCAMPLHDRLGVRGTIRASAGLYTNSDDIKALSAALAKVQEMLL